MFILILYNNLKGKTQLFELKIIMQIQGSKFDE